MITVFFERLFTIKGSSLDDVPRLTLLAVAPNNLTDSENFWIYISKTDGTRDIRKYLAETTGITLITTHDISTYPAGLTIPSNVVMENFLDADIFEDAYGNLWFAFVVRAQNLPSGTPLVDMTVCNSHGTGVHHQYRYNGSTYSYHFVIPSYDSTKKVRFKKTNRTEVVLKVEVTGYEIGTPAGGPTRNITGNLRAFTTGTFQDPSYWNMPLWTYTLSDDVALSPIITPVENELGISEIEVYEPVIRYIQSIHYPKRFFHEHGDHRARVTMWDPLNSVYFSNSPFTSIRKISHTLLVTAEAKDLGPNYSVGLSGASQYSEAAEKAFVTSGAETDIAAVKTLITALYAEVGKISAVGKILAQQTLGGL